VPEHRSTSTRSPSPRRQRRPRPASGRRTTQGRRGASREGTAARLFPLRVARDRPCGSAAPNDAALRSSPAWRQPRRCPVRRPATWNQPCRRGPRARDVPFRRRYGRGSRTLNAQAVRARSRSDLQLSSWGSPSRRRPCWFGNMRQPSFRSRPWSWEQELRCPSLPWRPRCSGGCRRSGRAAWHPRPGGRTCERRVQTPNKVRRRLTPAQVHSRNSTALRHGCAQLT